MRYKNLFLLSLVIVAILLWAINSDGAVHTVASGETLGSIGNQYDFDYRKIKRVIDGRTVEIQNKNFIKSGWKLYIPFNSQTQVKKKKKLGDAVLKTYIVKSGDTLYEIGKEFGVEYKTEIFRLNDGNPVEIENKRLILPGEKLLISSAGSSVVQTQAAKEKKFAQDSGEGAKPEKLKVEHDFNGNRESRKADNFYSALNEVNEVKKKKKPQPKKNQESKEKELVSVKSFGEALETVNVTYSNYGDLDVSGEDRERSGYNWDVRVRFRPLEIGNWDVGLWGYYNDGVSKSKRSDGRRDRYEYYRYAFGPSAEWEKDNLSLALEAAFARQVTKGSYSHSDRTQEQTTEMLEFRAWLESDARRKDGAIWFPKWGIGAKYLHPISEEFKSSDGEGEIYDEARWDVSGVAWMYDWWFSSNWRLTPGLNTRLGYLYGKESLYIQGGPRLELGTLYNEILDVSFLNPRYFFEEEARDASRIYWISATLKVDDLARTVWASQIKDYDGSSSGSSEEKVSRKKERERSPFYNKRGIDSP